MSKTLHKELRQLRKRATAWVTGKDPKKFMPNIGICANLSLNRLDERLLQDLLVEWPESTGSRHCPVPHPYKHHGSAFMQADKREMWDPKYEYARNRLALLEWLIEQTKPTEES